MMEHTKKMVLVPQELLSLIQAKQAERTPPVDNAMMDIDQNMRNVLDNSGVDEDEKAKMYNQQLQKYRVYSDKKDVPVSVKIIDSDKTSKEENKQTVPMEDEILNSIPKTFRNRGHQLIKKLKGSAVSWNQDGELLLDGSVIPGTNIVDLVNDVVRRRKGFIPQGWEVFAKGLARLNIPRDIIGNLDRWMYIQETRYPRIPQEVKQTKRKITPNTIKKHRWSPYQTR